MFQRNLPIWAMIEKFLTKYMNTRAGASTASGAPYDFAGIILHPNGAIRS